MPNSCNEVFYDDYASVIQAGNEMVVSVVVAGLGIDSILLRLDVS